MTPSRYMDQYNNTGHIVIPNVFTKEQIAELKNRVHGIHQQWLSGFKQKYQENLLVNMHSLTLPEYFNTNEGRIDFFNAFTTSNIVSQLRNIFQEDLYFHNSQLFFNPYRKKGQPYWHRDMQYSPISEEEQQAEHHNMLSLHVRIPLVKETGVELIPDSHLRWDTELEHQVRFEREGHQNHETLPGSKLILLEVGDVLIFNSQMIHRGHYEINPERFALDLCIGKPHPFALKFCNPEVLPTSEDMVQLQNPEWFRNAQNMKGQHNKSKKKIF